jgi:Rnl2 family RNA ligase
MYTINKSNFVKGGLVLATGAAVYYIYNRYGTQCLAESEVDNPKVISTCQEIRKLPLRQQVEASYLKFPNVLDQKWAESADDYGYGKQPWVVLEKVHGANMCFMTDGVEVLHGSRNLVINDEKLPRGFNGLRSVYSKYNEPTIKLYTELKKKYPDLNILYVFGELHGGFYTEDTITEEEHTHLQTGVDYCPDNKYIAFDIQCVMKDGSVKWEDYDMNTILLLESCGFWASQILAQGTLAEIKNYNIEFESTLPAYYGITQPWKKVSTDTSAREKNLSEGIVIKPVKTCFLPGGERLAIKIKNELVSAKKTKPRYIPDVSKFKDYVNELVENGIKHVNHDLVESEVMKIGGPEEVLKKDFARWLRVDTWDTLKRTHSDLMGNLTPDEERYIKKQIEKHCRIFLSESFPQYVNNQRRRPSAN